MKKVSQFLALFAQLPKIFAERFDKSPIASMGRLSRFVHTRAAYIAQESLYGYLKARMGTKYPQYFQDEVFSRAIRAATLKLFISCLSDLTVFTVAVLGRETGAATAQCTALARDCFRRALREGLAAADCEPVPDAALVAFEERLERTLWTNAECEENAFTGSIGDVIRFAPVIEEFKKQDSEIVCNSIRFRWRDVREQFRRRADARGVIADWCSMSS